MCFINKKVNKGNLSGKNMKKKLLENYALVGLKYWLLIKKFMTEIKESLT